MRIDILCLFPEIVTPALSYSLLSRAIEQGLVDIKAHNLRDFSRDKHRTVDDYSFGGGPGMVLKPEPIFEAVDSLRGERSEVILLSPQGELFNQGLAQDLVQKEHLILICGRYEGVDERVRQNLVYRELSIGDYILSGGEVAALVVVDVLVRLVPGVVGSAESLKEESLNGGLLEYPQYTRPAQYRGQAVPSVLLSGDHQAVARWRRQQALLRTLRCRPDLLAKAELTMEDKRFLAEVK